MATQAIVALSFLFAADTNEPRPAASSRSKSNCAYEGFALWCRHLSVYGGPKMLQSSPCVQRLSRMVVLSAIVLLLSHTLTFARAFSIGRSPQIRAEAGKPAPNPPDLHRLEVGKPLEREMQG